ncbi:MAG: NAD(P)H-hydrate dehydratase [Clostridia bacterium]|nr:NAD(P)H-hydrate dehydratase [Clostridia bacterium]
MERILSVLEMRNADSYTINTLGIPSEILVERAGQALAEEIIKKFLGGRVLFCVGKGNNGNDGKVASRILSQKHGFSVALFDVEKPDFSLFDNKFDIIVDCVFGTGLNKEVTGDYKKIINLINESNAKIVACDIPSGLNGDNGLSMGACVKADLTVAIQEYKTGYFLNDGPDYCGEIIKKDIGISIWGDYFVNRLQNADVSTLFYVRNKNVNKGNFGKTAIVGGSKNFPGSVLISSLGLSALKMGTGYVTLVVPNCIYNAVAGKVPECIINVFNDNGNSIVFDKIALDSLLKYDYIAFGMGATVSDDVYSCIKYLLSNYKGKLLLDADALNSLAKYGVDVLLAKSCNVVLTPHIAEFARLLGVDKSVVMQNPINLAKEFAEKYGVTLVLKSATTVITDGNTVYLNTTGNSSLAKGGSGDLLSGITAGLLARNNNVTFTCACASYLMGLASEIATKNGNEYTVTATDVINALPQAINSL